MMTYPNAAAGLKTVYQARLVGLISIVLVIVPIVQVLAVAAMLIAGFLALVGLAQCRKDDKGSRTAFNMVIAGLVTNLAAQPGFCFCRDRGGSWHLQQYSIDRYRCIITGFAVLCMHYHQSPTERNGCRGKSD